MDRDWIQTAEIGGYLDYNSDSEAERLCAERFDRFMSELHEKSRRDVEALGFSSWEEKSRHDSEQLEKAREEHIRVHGPPKPHIPTRQEEEASKVQLRKSLACDIAAGIASPHEIQLYHQLEKEYELEDWIPEDGGWCREPEQPREPCSCKGTSHPR